MDTIRTDNDSVFKRPAFADAMATLGIPHTHALPSKPSENGRVEKFFRQVQDEFSKQWQGDGNTPVSLAGFEKELKKFIDNRNSGLSDHSAPAAD